MFEKLPDRLKKIFKKPDKSSSVSENMMPKLREIGFGFDSESNRWFRVYEGYGVSFRVQEDDINVLGRRAIVENLKQALRQKGGSLSLGMIKVIEQEIDFAP